MKLSPKVLEFFRFCLVGGMALIIQYGLYYFGIQYIENFSLAYVLSYFFSALFNYCLTVRYTFAVEFSQLKLLGFLACHLFNLIFQVVLLNFALFIGMEASLAPIPVYVIAVPTNFILVRLVMTRLH